MRSSPNGHKAERTLDGIVCSMSEHSILLAEHYGRAWGANDAILRASTGRYRELKNDFCVLRFPPRSTAGSWTYATCGMSDPDSDVGIELFMFSPVETARISELLNVTAHFHQTAEPLGLDHTVNFGQPWLPGSICDHALVSLPYTVGPKLEMFVPAEGKDWRCLWLIPITTSEVDYKKQHGVEALEEVFEKLQIDYVDPRRRSCV